MAPELMHLVGGVASVVALVGGAIWWCMQRHIKHLWQKIRALEDQRRAFQRKLERADERQARTDDLFRKAKARLSIQAERVTELQAQLDQTLGDKETLRVQAAQLETTCRKYKTGAEKLNQMRLDLEKKVKDRDIEVQRYSQACEHLKQDIARFEQQVAELRERGGLEPELAEFVKKREQELTAAQEQQRALEMQLKLKDSSLEVLRQTAFEQEKRIERLNDEMDELVRQNQEIGSNVDQKARLLEESSKKCNELLKQLDDLKQEYNELSMERIQEPGRIWERPERSGSPEFVPLGRRSMPIISVINLKGGVGKTTVTANLGAMLGLHGKRVLLIDLDYQRSLTLLCGVERHVLHQEKRTLQHLLLDSNPDARLLLGCTIPVAKAGGCALIGNTESKEVKGPTDSLEEAEMHLQAEWLMNPRGVDVRFLLRGALQAPAVSERFDYVLLDCPPRLSTACINALAASDFALVPVGLDNVSAVSALNLLRKLMLLRSKGILANMNLLGVLANRVKFYEGELVNLERAEWAELQDHSRSAWDTPVYFFETMIKQSKEFGRAAVPGSKAFAAFSHELKPVFTDLMAEFEKRILHESGRPAAVSAVVA